MATRPAPPCRSAAPRLKHSTRGLHPTRVKVRTRPAKRFTPPRAFAFLPSVDLAGRAVALSADIPTVFDQPLAPHHKLIGHWIGTREDTGRVFTRAAARRHIEQVFDAAVMEILSSIDCVDLRIAVLGSEEDASPAIAIICESLGQLDLGWI